MARAEIRAGRKRSTSSLTFNHAMIYSRDVGQALGFYRDLLGFRVIEEMEYHERAVYARLRPPKGTSTIAIHLLEPGASLSANDAIRLYFEVKDLKKFCASLEKSGVRFSQLPKQMPWGWEHAYLNDPDGHEVSLYWAGNKRFRKSKMKT
jgi:catechol 2,3-dioxygenase-like lactoylglutathione lyase family enzyme